MAAGPLAGRANMPESDSPRRFRLNSSGTGLALRFLSRSRQPAHLRPRHPRARSNSEGAPWVCRGGSARWRAIAMETRVRATHLMRYAPSNFYAVMPETDKGRK